MSHISKPPLGEPDAQLLRALQARYPGERFDECNISVDAPRSPELLRALDFLSVRINRRQRSLSYASHRVVEQWLVRAEGRPANGLSLAKDARGWSHIVSVGMAPTGPAR
jgi:hypothetical protein